MAIAPKGGIPSPGFVNYPKGQPNPRVDTPTGQPPVTSPGKSSFAAFKAGLPKLPPVTQLFHKPRKAGNG